MDFSIYKARRSLNYNSVKTKPRGAAAAAHRTNMEVFHAKAPLKPSAWSSVKLITLSQEL